MGYWYFIKQIFSQPVQQAPTYDMNVFLATLASCGAAIAAIIGGFLTSFLLTLIGEQRTLQNEVDAYEDQIAANKKHIRSKKKESQELREEIYLAGFRKNLLLSSTGVEKNTWVPSTSKSQIIPECEEWFEKTVEYLQGTHTTWLIDYTQRLLDLLVAKEQLNDLLEEARSKDLWESDWYLIRRLSRYIPEILPVNDPKRQHYIDVHNNLEAVANKEIYLLKRNRHDIAAGISMMEYYENLGVVDAEVRQFETEAMISEDKKKSAQSRLQGEPPYDLLYAGFGCILAVLITGVVIPLLYIPCPPMTEPPAWQSYMLGGFFGSLLVLFAYLNRLVFMLKRGKKKGSSRSA